jgi:hypothetical protein
MYFIYIVQSNVYVLVCVSYPIVNNKSFISTNNPYSTQRADTPHIRPQTQNLNQNFQSYKILRGRIVDKIQEVIITLDNPNSSINRFINALNNKYGSEHSNKFLHIIDKIYYNSDQLLSTDTTDSYEYFENMKRFTKYIDTLSNEASRYLNSSDTVDGFNPLEINDNLRRIANDFHALDKSESSFPRAFRQSYVSENQKVKP